MAKKQKDIPVQLVTGWDGQALRDKIEATGQAQFVDDMSKTDVIGSVTPGYVLDHLMWHVGDPYPLTDAEQAMMAKLPPVPAPSTPALDGKINAPMAPGWLTMGTLAYVEDMDQARNTLEAIPLDFWKSIRDGVNNAKDYAQGTIESQTPPS